MKKIVCVLLAMFIYANNVFAYGNVNYEDFNEYKSKYRILYGAILVVGGAFLAYDGFRTIKVDMSKATYNLNFSSYWIQDSGNFKYVITTTGTITNTGNVDFRNVKVWVRYKTKNTGTGQVSGHYEISEHGTQITYEGNASSGPLAGLLIGESHKWNDPTASYTTAGTNPPNGTASVSETDPTYVDNNYNYPSSIPSELVDIADVSFDYTKKYKEEMNNVYEGLLGVLLIGGGAYLLIDYIVSVRRFDYYMKQNNMNLFVTNTGDEFKLMLSKKL